ncbi:MAG: dTDP-4-dehydrorhamnose reductase [Bacteroidales bacterium]|nr:dTDP-4-dehydrorhamnose reductase [Bacteroidales bacterium]
MKILVTGANGQLGMSLRRIAGQAGNDEGRHARPDRASFVFTDVVDAPGVQTAHLDITDASAVRAMVAAEKVDTVINCAAYTNVDAAEDNPELAELLNATAVGILAEAMKEVDGLLVHISTDYVFGGDPYNTPCTEEQKGTPTGAYGLSKLHGEQAILVSGVRHIIIRTGWLYSEYGKNFVKTMLKLTAERPQLSVVFDQVGTPTYAGDLAAAIVAILGIAGQARNEGKGGAPHPGLDPGSLGIYNYSNEGVCSWYDFAKTIAEYAGHTSCDIRPCHSNEFPSKVHRPSYSVLDKTKIKNTFGLQIPYWTESLKKCIQNLNA